MNRRQFLTGASAIAVSAALPVQPVAHAWGETITADELIVAMLRQRMDDAYAVLTRGLVDSIYKDTYGPHPFEKLFAR